MNYETRCVKIKLKSNSLEKVREWKRVIDERKDEALATLRDEGVILETVFLDQTSEGDFLIYVMKAESFEKVNKIFEKSVHAIDEYHRKFMNENYADRKKLELLIDLDRTSEIE